ncbi:hypothetical protein J6X96_01380 [bacterium]|nr:hypothetical protein [bacterium]
MFKDNLKKLFLSLTVLLLALCSTNAQANVPDYLSIVGPSQISVGKTNVQYHLSYHASGIFDGCDFWAKTNGVTIADNSANIMETTICFDAPTNECTISIEAIVYYNTAHDTLYLVASKTVYVRKPDLQCNRLGLEEMCYTNNNAVVPVHWNIDDDDRSGYGQSTETRSGEDYKQSELMTCDDDDLYSIQAHIGNTVLDTANCNLKIKTSDSLRLWYSQNKGELCCDADSVFETNCNIKIWFNNKTNSNGNRLYAEWIRELPVLTNAFIDFYCNNVQFAKLRYKGYAFTKGALPNTAERTFFETNFFLDGCEWGIVDGKHRHDRNSLAEAVDGNPWPRYGEAFVVTTSSPLCSNIYTLQDHIYNTFNCRCISMDTFGDRSHSFEESDATAFFTTNNFWQDNFYNMYTYPLYSDIIYYNGQFAARKIEDVDRLNCHPSWAMFSSRFFNRPKIVHRAEQLAPVKTIQKTYIIGPPPEPENQPLEEE